MKKTLTPKQEKFCREVASGKNLSDAYRSAFDTSRMTKKSTNERACVLSKLLKIKTRIAELTEKAAAKVTMTREEWFLEMEKIMRGDVRKMFDGPGNVVEISELGDNEAALIEGFELVENFEKVGDKAEHVGYTKKVKLTPKLKRALEFGKVMGWYQEKKDNDGTFTLEQLIDAMEKVKG